MAKAAPRSQPTTSCVATNSGSGGCSLSTSCSRKRLAARGIGSGCAGRGAAVEASSASEAGSAEQR
eukprot:CAMPEP_0198511206 /NCGR_PEP_ID=MMETSP1462-20131121/14665_1 /TAXON_ID=1333877 /ORGANISM="Brandtodinium nutriculum, Strain RCC3387" /LENGTH=65 /DNA_ID=CAMNT_0044240567 /DNA_START=12 /DNA_END=205 /DNA_ORIENTATION=-